MTLESTFAARRRRFMEAIGDAVAVIPAGREMTRNRDTEYEFRQDSEFFYLTGFEEPDAVAIVDPRHDDERFVLLVRPRDRVAEIWNGRRAGPEGAVERTGADAAYPLEDLDDKLREHLLHRPVLYYRWGAPIDGAVRRALRRAKGLHDRRGWTYPTSVVDPEAVLADLRLHKSPDEIEDLRRACRISAAGHREAMRFARPGLYEYQVQAALEYVFRLEGSRRNGYPSIVASGANACILHYRENDRQMSDGDLLLIDAGAEYRHFSADVTRTFPVGGAFSPPQRSIYEVVLAAQLAAIDECRPGRTLDDVHDAARRVITEGLVDLGLLPRTVEDSLAMHHYREFFMHGTGHWLGIDVHDVGSNQVEGKPRPLEPGMVLTVEPGIYVDPDRPVVELALLAYDEGDLRDRAYLSGRSWSDQAAEDKRDAETVTHELPDRFLGIGVRIEDDVLVTEDGPELLDGTAPRAVAEVEAVCREAPTLPLPG